MPQKSGKNNGFIPVKRLLSVFLTSF